MFCNQCGKPNNNTARFCSGCGNSLENQHIQITQTQVRSPENNKDIGFFKHLWFIFLFIVSIIMLLGVFPYQLISGNFEFTYILVLFFWIWVCQYTYTRISLKKLIKDTSKAFNALDEAKAWLNTQEIEESSVQFSYYSDPYLIKNNGAILLVAVAKYNNGKPVGFAVEVKQGCGVLSSLIIEPEGIASQHKKAASIAKMEGKHLINVLNQMATQHRINHF